MIEYLVFECSLFSDEVAATRGNEPGLEARLNALIAEGWEKDYLQTFSDEGVGDRAHVVMKREKPRLAESQPEAGPSTVRSDEGFARICTQERLDALDEFLGTAGYYDLGSQVKRLALHDFCAELRNEMAKRRAGR